MRPSPLRAGMLNVFSLCILAAAADANTVTLADFESAMPASIGDAYLDGGAVGTGPLQGASQGVLTTDASSGAVNEASLGNAFENGIFTKDVPDNLPSKIWKTHLQKKGISSASGVAEGSALQITFSADAGDHFRFDFDFLTNDVSRDPAVFTDFAWFQLDPPTGHKQSGVFAHTNQGGFSTFSGPGYEHHTGTQTFNFDITSTGTYTITLGVNDVEDSFRDSALVVDWIRLVKGPEPGTFGTLALGLMGLNVFARRRRR